MRGREGANMYYVYDVNNQLIQTTQYPGWQAYDPKVESFYATTEEKARALLVMPETEGSESYYANVEGKEGYPWLAYTVKVTTTPIN